MSEMRISEHLLVFFIMPNVCSLKKREERELAVFLEKMKNWKVVGEKIEPFDKMEEQWLKWSLSFCLMDIA